MAYEKQNPNGQATMANSSPVVIASNQTKIPVAGDVASASTDSGNPVKTGGIYNATQPTFTDGQRGDTQIGARGETIVMIKDGANKASIDTAGADAESNTSSRLNVSSHPSMFNGTTWDRQRGDTTNGLDVDVTRLPALVAGTAVIGKVGIDQTTPGTTNLVAADITKVAGTAIVTGGTNGTQAIGGIQAHDAADSGNNPVKIGAKATSSEPAGVSSGDIANLLTDLVGKLIVLPYANPENFVSGAITSAMTGTTSTSLIAAPASGLRNYITQITVSNSHATVGTDVIIQDGSGGTTLYTIPAAAVYGGATITFPVPLRQPTTATAIYCANVTTGASTKVSASGYKGA